MGLSDCARKHRYALLIFILQRSGGICIGSLVPIHERPRATPFNPVNTLDQIPTQPILRAHRRLSLSHLLMQAVVRLFLAAALSAAVVATAVAGMMVTSAPRWVSLTLEPFSLLLMPGALFAWAEAAFNKLDFSGTTAIRVNVLFYFFAFAFWLLHHLRHKIYPRASRPTHTSRSR